ncbi:MAG: hypothetical protein HW387_935 [Parachlamydiales bacterium]|nr:hypothetical protein [Parachlamydiales bacterium]
MAINVNVVSIVQAQQQILQDHEKSLQDHEKSLQDTQKCLQDQGKCSKDQSMRIQNKDQRTQDLADEVFNLKRNVEGKDRFEMEIRLNELKDRLNFIQLKLGEYSNTKTEQTVAGIRRAVTGSLGGLVGGVAVAAAGIAAFAISGPAVPIVVCSGLTSSFSGAVYGFISKFNIAADREQRYKLLQMRDGRLRDMMLVKYEIQSIERHLNKKMK